MTAEELERALSRIRQMTAAARQRLDVLVNDLKSVRADIDTLVAPKQPSENEQENEGRKGTSEAEVAQAEVVFK